MGETENKFKTNIVIAEYNVDMHGNIKISSLLRHMQEVGSLHLEALGSSYEDLASKGYVYLLVNLRTVLYRKIESHEVICFHTWVPKNSGFRTYRNFRLCDQDGNIVGESSTVWVLTDVNTHKISNLKDSPVSLVFNTEEKLGIPEAKKVKMPKNMRQSSTRKIRYTDLDVNSHVNNSIYGDIFCDEAEIDFSKYWINDFSINYRKEAIFGDTIDISQKTEVVDNVPNVYLAGFVGDTSSFEVSAKLKQK